MKSGLGPFLVYLVLGACLKTSLPKQLMLKLKSGDFAPHDPNYWLDMKMRFVELKVRWSIHSNIDVDLICWLNA